MALRSEPPRPKSGQVAIIIHSLKASQNHDLVLPQVFADTPARDLTNTGPGMVAVGKDSGLPIR